MDRQTNVETANKLAKLFSDSGWHCAIEAGLDGLLICTADYPTAYTIAKELGALLSATGPIHYNTGDQQEPEKLRFHAFLLVDFEGLAWKALVKILGYMGV